MGWRERVVASVVDIRDRGQRLVQLNLELLAGELKEKGKRFGAAIGLLVGAAALALYAFGFALATVTVVLALILPLWLSLLLVTTVLFALIAILVAVGRAKLRQAQTPAPQAALAEAGKTAELMRTGVRETVAGVRAAVMPRRAGAAAPAPESRVAPSGGAVRPPEDAPDEEVKDS